MTPCSFYSFENNKFEHRISFSHDGDPLSLLETGFFENILNTRNINEYNNALELLILFRGGDGTINQLTWLYCFYRNKLFVFNDYLNVWFSLSDMFRNSNSKNGLIFYYGEFSHIYEHLINTSDLIKPKQACILGIDIWHEIFPEKISFRP